MINIIQKSEFAKNVLVLMTGTTISQAIPILISPILTRYYSSDDFGLFALFLSLISVFTIIATGKYDLAILLPKKDSDAKQLLFLCFILSLSFCLLLLFVIIIFYDYFITLKPDLLYYEWLYLVPLGVLLLSFYQILVPYENRKKNYRNISISMVHQNLVAGFINLITILIHVSYWGLILGKIVGILFSYFSLLNYGKSNILKINLSVIRIKKLMKRYIKFPKFSLPADFLSGLTTELPTFLFISFYSSSVVGFYALAMRVVITPISIIGSSITNVFRKEAVAQYIENGNCLSLFNRTLKILVLLSIIPFSLLAIYSPEIFAFVFGEKWRIAGEYTRIMTIMFFFKFIVGPLSYMYYIAEKQKEDLYLHVYILTSGFISIYLGYEFFSDVYYSLLFYSINWVLIYIYTGIRSYIFAKGQIK